jgi:hypothetical protein
VGVLSEIEQSTNLHVRQPVLTFGLLALVFLTLTSASAFGLSSTFSAMGTKKVSRLSFYFGNIRIAKSRERRMEKWRIGSLIKDARADSPPHARDPVAGWRYRTHLLYQLCATRQITASWKGDRQTVPNASIPGSA